MLYVHGDTWKYLQLAEGALSSSIMDMVREGIRPTLSNAINEVLSKGETVVREGARTKINGNALKLKITVKPVIMAPRGPQDTEGKNLYSILKEADIPELHKLAESEAPSVTQVEDVEIDCNCARTGRRKLRINGYRLSSAPGANKVLLVIEDLGISKKVRQPIARTKT